MITDLLPNSTPELLAITDLAPTAKGVLVGTMVGGTLLLLFGARLLRPAVVLAAMLVGFLGSVVVARALLPGVPLWAAAAFGAVAGLLAGALLYRPTVGLLGAVVGATVGALVAFAIIAGGTLDTAPRNLDHALVANPREAAHPGEGNRAGKHLLEILTGPRASDEASAHRAPQSGTDAALSNAADSALPVGDRALQSTVDVTHRAGDRIQTAYQETAPAYRTLLSASIGAGAVIGFLMGLLATTLVARILTSLAGAWILVVGALPLLAMNGYEPMPSGARGWLIVLVSLTALGTLAQGVLGGGRANAKTPARAPRPATTKQSTKAKSPVAPKATIAAVGAD
ncbi:MAG: hypothetical protein NT059_07610 [Planctomycetota bacterium]|nr:hypothetical protein [Planctomycetota bacterium]